MDKGSRHVQTVPTGAESPCRNYSTWQRREDASLDTRNRSRHSFIVVVRDIKGRGCPCPERPTAVSSPRPILSKRSRNVHACALRFGVTQKNVYHPSHGMTYAGDCGTVNPGTFGPSLCHAVHIDDISRTHVVSVPVMIIKYGLADYR